MKTYLEKSPREIKRLISSVKEVSRETKMPAYLVGGFPRDLILGVRDWDLDITVEGDGIGFAEKLAKKLDSRLVRHERFGTATLILGDRLKLDVATTRKERYPACACLPLVSSGSLAEDLFRRDFTINAMAIALSGKKGWELIDKYRGKEDLASGKIRVLHRSSFKDDPTRILRGIRFMQRYNFKIEKETLDLLKEAVASGLLHRVHPHRIRDELVLMLKEKDPSAQVKRLHDLAGLSFVSSKLKPGRQTFGLFKSVNKQVSWFMEKLPCYGDFEPWIIYFAALLRPLSREEAKEIIRKLGFTATAAKKILGCRRIGSKLVKSLKRRGIKPARVFSLLKPLSLEEIIFLRSLWSDSLFRRNISDFLGVYNRLRLSITGDDLCRMGVMPGPGFRKILNRVLVARLDGKAGGRRQELALAGKIIRQLQQRSGARCPDMSVSRQR
ncbi:MAG: hypothetical protein PHW98_00315 [Candidatus Omnitrophica bacterium]|nr:hypothetical protein [Candidatus Omnitrophota bacterium]MDD5770689.1 hypothetical protein [Candidatus Omnitrophota bacterium]